MSQIIFPPAPEVNDFYTAGDVTYMWDGTKWVSTMPSPVNIGATGPAGSDGPAGPPGGVGATGIPGPFGPQGITGASGATGIPGPFGPQGITGASGATGPTGPDGATGTFSDGGNVSAGIITASEIAVSGVATADLFRGRLEGTVYNSNGNPVLIPDEPSFGGDVYGNIIAGTSGLSTFKDMNVTGVATFSEVAISGLATADLFRGRLEGTVYNSNGNPVLIPDEPSFGGDVYGNVIAGSSGLSTFKDVHVTGVLTTPQIDAPGGGDLFLDGDFLPVVNRRQDLGSPTKSWKKVYIKSGPKAIEFEDTNIGLGLTVNAQLENILEFDGHELFVGDGDIGHHGNLRNVYATGIVSATVGAQVGVLTATTITSSGAALLVRTDLVPSADNTYELGSATNRWKDIYLDGGESVLNIGSVSIGATDGHLTVDGNEVAEYDGSGDIGVLGNLRNITLTGIITGYNAGIVTYYGDGNNLDLPVTSGGGGAIAMKYKSSSNTTMSDPGKGKWRLNNLTQATATQMAVDVVTSGGYSINALLAAITPGTKIFLQRKDKPEAYFTFVVNTAPTLQGTISDGWYLFPSITNLRDGGTGIADNKDCVLAFKAPNQVSGESITPSTVSVAGSVTAANFYGDGSGITGIAATISAATATNFTWNASLLPDTNEAYDLGSASNKVRHLYLSDSSLYTDSGVLSVGLTTQVGLSSKVLMGNKLKEIVAASVDFADFQAKVAAEDFDTP